MMPFPMILSETNPGYVIIQCLASQKRYKIKSYRGSDGPATNTDGDRPDGHVVFRWNRLGGLKRPAENK